MHFKDIKDFAIGINIGIKIIFYMYFAILTIFIQNKNDNQHIKLENITKEVQDSNHWKSTV